MYEKIEREIAARYSLGYLSTDTRTNGAWREVEISSTPRPEGRQAPHPRRLFRPVQAVQFRGSSASSLATWRQAPGPR